MSAHPEGKKALLRTAMADVELAMRDLESAPVRDAWQRLVVALELGPDPAVRVCPHCGKLGMAGATRCGFCWGATPVGDKSP